MWYQTQESETLCFQRVKKTHFIYAAEPQETYKLLATVEWE